MTCNKPDCNEPRWFGPKGTNRSNTFCETHQREYWRVQAAKKPKKSKGALLEDGTIRTAGKPRKNAPKPVTEKFATLVAKAEVAAKKQEMIKVVVVNRTMDIAQLVEVPVISDLRWSEVRRPDDLLRLLRGSGHVVVYTDRDKV